MQSLAQSISIWYKSQTWRTQMIVAVVGVLAIVMFLYWFFVRFVGKNMSDGKSFVDNTSSTKTNTGSGSAPNFQDSPQLFASELMTALEYTWGFGFVCGNPDNLCYRLNSLLNKGDDYIKAVGRDYGSISSMPLSEAIKNNPCECLASCWTCRTTKYPANKAALIQKLQQFGY